MFDVLYAQHTPTMLGLAARILGNRDDAEDAVQDAWLRAIGALHRFAWRSSLRTWLCGFVVNCCRERVRRRADIEAPPQSVEQRETVDVERAIAAIPLAAREVFVLHEIYGCTHEEIGEIAGIDAGTSRSQLHHARRAFRAHFEVTDGKRTERT
jgi:RNA polymerase sigma-70 factor (ECF subfamily)